jgi:hypothetical protein
VASNKNREAGKGVPHFKEQGMKAKITLEDGREFEVG